MALLDVNDLVNPPQPNWLTSLPTLASPAAPPPTGFLPAMGSALKSGLYGQIAAPLAQTVQGIGALTGLPKLQEFGAAGARGWEQQAQAAATPELEQQGWFGSPKSFAYHLAQAIPGTAAMIGGAALGPETAIPRIGEMIGAGVAAFPSMFGSNIQNEEANGPLTQGGAARAAGLAVPESAAMGFMPSSLKKFAESGLDGDIVKRMFTAGGAAAAQQAGAQAGITAATDAVYNPEMPADERARRIVSSALSGGAMGLVIGGAFGAVRRSVEAVPKGGAGTSNDALAAAIDKAMSDAQEPIIPQPDMSGFEGLHDNLTPTSTSHIGDVSSGGFDKFKIPDTLTPAPAPNPPTPLPVREPIIPQSDLGEFEGLHDNLEPTKHIGDVSSGGFDFTLPSKMNVAEAGLAEAQKPVPPPEAAAFMDKTLAGMNKRSADKIRTDPFFANVADEPALINAIKARAEVYDKADKDLPKGLQKLVDQFGTDTEAAEHVKRAGDLATVASTLPEAAKALPEAQQLAEWHAEAVTRKAAAYVPLPKDGPGMIADSRIKPLLDSLIVDRTKPVPYGAGADVNKPNLVHIDPSIPAKLPIMGVDVNTGETLGAHEIVEKHLEDNEKKTYPAAHHEGGEVAEKAVVQNIGREGGIPEDKLEEFYRSYSDKIAPFVEAARARAPAEEKAGAITPEGLFTPPYHQEGDAKLVGATDALQKRGAAPLGAGEPSGVGGGVGPGDAAGAAAGARPDVAVTPEAAKANGNEQAGAGGARTAAQVGLKPNLKMAPEWANAAAAGAHGEVVYSHRDGEHAVIRSFDAWGDPQYQMVSHTGEIPSDDRISELKQAITQDRLKDKFEYQKNQEGPWKGKTDAVVGTRSVDSSDVGLVAGWLRQIGMGATKVALVHPQDARGDVAAQEGLNGPYQSARFSASADAAGDFAGLGAMGSFGPKQNAFYISTDPNLTPAGKVDTLGHEVGHVVELTALRNAPAATQKAVVDAHAQYRSKTQGVPLQDVIRMTRLRSNTDDVSQLTSDQQATFRSYVTSFSEWFADNVSRELTSAQEPTSVIGKFFYGVAQKLRQLMQAISGNQFLPDPAVAKFMSDLRANAHPEMWSNDISRGRMGDKIPVGEPAQFKRVPREQDRDAQAALSNIRGFAQRALQIAPTKWGNLREGVRKGLMGFTHLTQLPEIFGKDLPSAVRYPEFVRTRGAIEKTKVMGDQAGMRPYNSSTPELKAAISKYAVDAVTSGIKGDKPWTDDAYAGIHDDPEMMKQHADLRSQYENIRRLGGVPALEGLLKTGQAIRYQEIAGEAHDLIDRWNKTNPTEAPLVPGWTINPDKIYQFGNMHDDIDAKNAFYRGKVMEALSGIKQRIAASDTAAAAFPEKSAAWTAAKNTTAELRSKATLFSRGLGMADKGDYVPFMRSGDYFVSGKIAVGENNQTKPEATRAIEARLQKEGFGDVGVIHDNETNTMMVRVGDRSQMAQLAGIMQDLQKQRHFDETPIKNGYPDDINTFAGLGPKYMQQAVENIKNLVADLPTSTPEERQTKDEIVRGAMNQWMDMLPDHALYRSLQERKLVSGFNKDVGENMMVRSANSARASTGVSTRGEFAEIKEAIRQEANVAKENPNIDPMKRLIPQDLARELMKREAEQAWRVSNRFADAVQAGIHSVVIGFNPAYGLTVMSQIPLLLHGELSKTYGFAKSALAISRVGTRTFNIMKAVTTSPDWATFTVREAALRAAKNIPESDIQTIMHLDRSGRLSSTFSGEQATGGTGSFGHKWQTYANALGIYFEMVPRIVAALSARDLHTARFGASDPGSNKYVGDIVQNSQFPWNPGETPRQMSKKGIFGSFTPISLSFMQFQTHMIEKLYTESHEALTNQGGNRAEAGKFLASHLIAVTAIAGTMGLPMAAALAGAANKILTPLTGQTDWNVEGLYRSWLAKTFGPEVGDVIAKGLPRGLAGVDLSKLGDANLMPGTSVLNDDRKLEDSWRDWMKSMAGAGPNEIVNMFLGARDMVNGDYLLGATKMLPEGIKGLAEAAYMDKHGYVDREGRPYALKPGALDILKASLGLDPANLAQVTEQHRMQQGIDAKREYVEQNIDMHLSRAFFSGDGASEQYWMGQKVRMQMQHPGVMGGLESFLPKMGQNVQDVAMARGLGMPPGVKPQDISLRNTLGFLPPQ